MGHDINKIVDSVVEKVLSEAALDVPKKHTPLTRMTLAAAKELAAAVEKKAAEMGVKAVVAVADEGGNTVLVECMDDAFHASYDIAVNKAYTVTALKMPTKELAVLAAPVVRCTVSSSQTAEGSSFSAGGEPLLGDGKILGGLGVSGGTAEEDTALGEYGKTFFETKLR